MHIDNNELKPCPHCGGEAEYSHGFEGMDGIWAFVRCEDCGAGVSEHYFTDGLDDVEQSMHVLLDKCINAWNRGSATIHPDEDIEANESPDPGVCPHMSIDDVLTILTEFNKWRRSEGEYAWHPEDPAKNKQCPYSPIQIGQAIDYACGVMDTVAHLK